MSHLPELQSYHIRTGWVDEIVDGEVYVAFHDLEGNRFYLCPYEEEIAHLGELQMGDFIIWELREYGDVKVGGLSLAKFPMPSEEELAEKVALMEWWFKPVDESNLTENS